MAILGVKFKLEVLVLYPSDEDGEYIITNVMGWQKFWCIKYFCSADAEGDIQVYNLLAQMGSLSFDGLKSAADEEDEMLKAAIEEYKKKVAEAAEAQAAAAAKAEEERRLKEEAERQNIASIAAAVASPCGAAAANNIDSRTA